MDVSYEIYAIGFNPLLKDGELVDNKNLSAVFNGLGSLPYEEAMHRFLSTARDEMGLTQVTAAAALLTWPSTISRIERGNSRGPEDIARYRAWLEQQVEESR